MKLSISKYLLSSILVLGMHWGLGQIRIDHVVSVVADLDDTQKELTARGFRIKKGRLHENGLLNAHIKFSNHSSFELMTVKGNPGDAIAKEYQTLMEMAEGGVYLALTGHNHDSLKVLLTNLAVPYIETSGKSWSYLSFPKDSYLAHLFFISYHFDVDALKDPTDHPNKLTRIHSVELEGSEALYQFFENIGLDPDKKASTFHTATGNIILIDPSKLNSRPRLRRITFAGEGVPIMEINWQKVKD